MFQSLQGSSLNSATPQDFPQEGHDSLVTKAIFSPNGQHIVSCSTDHQVKLWDLSGNLLRNFEGSNGHTEAVRDVCIQPQLQPGQTEQDRLIISAGDDEIIRLWTRNGKKPRMTCEHGAKVRALGFNPQGNLFVSAGSEATLKLWDFQGHLVNDDFTGHEDWILDAAFSPDGHTIASASADATLRLWNLRGQELAVFQDPSSNDWVYSLAFSPNGQLLASASGQVIKLWDVNTGQLLRVFREHTDTVYDVEFCLDGQTLISASHDQTLKRWSLDGVVLRSFNEHHNNAVKSVSVSPNGRQFISSSYDRTVKLWEIDGKLEPVGSMPRQDKIPEVEELLKKACTWLDDYLWTNQNVSISDRYICSDVLSDE
jgi:WD40 repeat protein